MDKKKLEVIREQLKEAIAFLNSVDHPEQVYMGEKMTSHWPGYPELYNPETWTSDPFVKHDPRCYNDPIYVLWKRAVDMLERNGMEDELEQARQLEIADLLAASKKNDE